MDEFYQITDLEQLKALADPFRQRILDHFTHAPITTKQVADQMGEKPTKLYHHVELLEKTGLIRLVETRQNRGTLEKYYQAIARKFAVQHGLLNQQGSAMSEFQTMLLQALQSSALEAETQFDHANAKMALMSQTHLRLTPTQAHDLIRTLTAWLEGQTSDPTAASEYSLTITFFPLGGQHAD